MMFPVGVVRSCVEDLSPEPVFQTYLCLHLFEALVISRHILSILETWQIFSVICHLCHLWHKWHKLKSGSISVENNANV